MTRLVAGQDDAGEEDVDVRDGEEREQRVGAVHDLAGHALAVPHATDLLRHRADGDGGAPATRAPQGHGADHDRGRGGERHADEGGGGGAVDQERRAAGHEPVAPIVT